MEKEIYKIMLTDAKEIQKVFGVGYQGALKIRNGQTDPANSKMCKAVKELSWNAEAHAEIHKNWKNRK